MDYSKYSKSLIESFQKTFFPEKDWINRHKSVFNPDVHASMQLTYHRVAGIGAGLTKTLDELSNNKIFVDPKTNIKPVLTALSSIMNDIEKTLLTIQNYNTQFAQKYKRVLPEPSRRSGEYQNQRLQMFSQTRGEKNLPKLNTPEQSSAVPLMRDSGLSGVGSSGVRMLNGTLNKILGQLKTSHEENTEMLSDQISEQKYLNSRQNTAIPIAKPNVAERREKEESSGGIGSLIGTVLKPIESFLSPVAKILPGMLRLMGMNKVAGLVGRVPGLGLLTTATAGVIALDYLNKNPEVVQSLLQGVQDVVRFTIDGIGRLVGDNLPQTAATVRKLIVGGVSAIYSGFVDALKDSITKGEWIKATSEIALFGGVVWMTVSKLKKLAIAIEKMIPSSLGGGVDDYIDDALPAGDYSTTRGGRTKSQRARKLRKPTRGIGRRISGALRPKNLLKGGVAGIATGLVADVGLGLAEDAMDIDSENRYSTTGGKAAFVGASDIISTTAAFAAFGSVIPGVGTGLGALAGALYGTYKTVRGFDEANGKSREAIMAETEARLKLAGVQENEARVRSDIIASLIDDETMTKTGAAETAKALENVRSATESFALAMKSGDKEKIAAAEGTLAEMITKLKDDNSDVYKRKDEWIVGTGLGTSTEEKDYIKTLLTMAEKRHELDIQIRRKDLQNQIDAKYNETTNYRQRSVEFESHASGGDVADGLHTVGENGTEAYFKKGTRTKVFNRADSNLKDAIGSEFSRLGNDQAISITKEIADTTSDSLTEIGKIMESTVSSLLTQMSEIRTPKSDNATVNNSSNQNVVNNFNQNSSVISNKADSYNRLREFIPRFA
jgi:hypothetical protein